jgi:hypothetical protein
MVIGYYPHGDTICGAELTGERQCMFWEGASAGRGPSITLPEWVLGAANRLLQGIDGRWAARRAEPVAAVDRGRRAGPGHCAGSFGDGEARR